MSVLDVPTLIKEDKVKTLKYGVRKLKYGSEKKAAYLCLVAY